MSFDLSGAFDRERAIQAGDTMNTSRSSWRVKAESHDFFPSYGISLLNVQFVYSS